MRTTGLILLALSSRSATALTSGAIFEPKNFSVTEALKDIGVSVARLPAPKLNLAALSEGYISTSCTFAVNAETNKAQHLIELTQFAVQVSADPI
jgi:hypothetical protein